MNGLWQTKLDFVEGGKHSYRDRRKKTKRYHFIKNKRSKYRRLDGDYNKDFIEGRPPHPIIYNIWYTCFNSKKSFKEGYVKPEKRILKRERSIKLNKIKNDIESSYDMTFSIQKKTYPWI